METRRAQWSALAKLNLSLKVLGKRPDGYHELRTIFQTISLGDTLTVEYSPGRPSAVHLESSLDIPPKDNLIVRAAQALLEFSKVKGEVRFRLEKKIPMGGGLGGGSTDAASVLIGLPALIGAQIPIDDLERIGTALGSDVPFFLYGGTALGLGRGTELYPLPEPPSWPALVVAPEVHVSTPEAYRALGRPALTEASHSFKLNDFLALAWNLGDLESGEVGAGGFENDFEAVVFQLYPELASVAGKLRKRGAAPAMLTGSGAALFGIFRSLEERDRAFSQFTRERVFPVSLIRRRQYRAMWWRQLREHISEKTWPPPSRHSGQSEKCTTNACSSSPATPTRRSPKRSART